MVARCTGDPDYGSDGRLGLTPAARMFRTVISKVHERGGEPARQGRPSRISRRGQHGAGADPLGLPAFFRPGPKRGERFRRRHRDQVAKVLRARAVKADDRSEHALELRFWKLSGSESLSADGLGDQRGYYPGLVALAVTGQAHAGQLLKRR